MPSRRGPPPVGGDLVAADDRSDSPQERKAPKPKAKERLKTQRNRANGTGPPPPQPIIYAPNTADLASIDDKEARGEVLRYAHAGEALDQNTEFGSSLEELLFQRAEDFCEQIDFDIGLEHVDGLKKKNVSLLRKGRKEITSALTARMLRTTFQEEPNPKRL